MHWLAFILMFVGGLIVLGAGGECLIQGAARLARQLGISALVVGLTIVAFGTSAPEIAVSMHAAHRGQDDIAVANVVGSCIMNILIVLGIAALVRPLRVSRDVIRTDAPVMVLFSAFFMLFAIDNGVIGRGEGLFFVAALVVYTLFTYRAARSQPTAVEQEYESELATGPRSRPYSVLLLLVGLAGLVKGADLIVVGAVGIADLLGVSKRIIGLTVVALGTSLPEVATCLVAARHNHPDIAIGNVIGSNIFNILAVIGITSVFFQLDVNPQTVYFDAPVMLAVVVLALPVLRTGHEVSRREGLLFLALYGAYLGWILRPPGA
jgi:cation:H+ antiporter